MKNVLKIISGLKDISSIEKIQYVNLKKQKKLPKFDKR